MKAAPAYLKGTVRRSTYLKTGGEFSGLLSKDPVGAAIFEGHVDFDMGLTTSVSARLRKPFFNKCFTKFNQEIPLNLRIERRPENPVQKAQSRTLDLSIIKDFDKLT